MLTDNYPPINKSWLQLEEDFKIKQVSRIANEIERLKEILSRKGLKYSTWIGDFSTVDLGAERNKLWENAWIISNCKITGKESVLDVGGASTIFSFYLASKGCEVFVIDIDWFNYGLVSNAQYVNKKMGWNMRIFKRNITLPFPFQNNYFDHVFCISVLEHLPSSERQKVSREMGRVLKINGILGLTFDYDEKRGQLEKSGDNGLRFSMFRKIKTDIINPSGLSIYGNTKLTDDCPKEHFMGALFLKKRATNTIA